MITIRCNHYNDKEVYMLFKLLRTSESEFLAENCMETCDNCEYKHLCYDLEKARRYMRDLKELTEL